MAPWDDDDDDAYKSRPAQQNPPPQDENAYAARCTALENRQAIVEAPDDGDTRPAMPPRRRLRRVVPRCASSRDNPISTLYQQRSPRADIEHSSTTMEKTAGVSVATARRQQEGGGGGGRRRS
ncbi:uncharacterized protein ARB_07165 [Trichophyton benhamiae CBS 112371]|uniref:Uncharacterized protein n=1 Tax=Arthroderma benhamiae (strain ATCC MYA-4681 / CBS 112371) TaxID=663331 RepID=D4ASF0_ARTBC|nr:uncharacterized protein ARB_07165 [Trichophyton benhamiae CBS 112371]EFE34214.1 hypothetical protein ARB_07165 [Trichophyton benhamiae CBS 112371]